MKIPTLHMILITAAILLVAPILRASELDKKTIVTFSQPVAIPGGTVLPAGEYVIKRADPSMPDVVRFMNADETKVLATVRALPTQRTEPAENVEIAFEERPSAAPQAVKKWFYPGDLTGAEFVYAGSDYRLLASNYTPLEPSGSASVPRTSSQPATAGAGSSNVQKTAGSEPTEIAQAQPASAQGQTTPAPQQRESQSAPAEQPGVLAAGEELPATSSRLPLAASLGALSILAGAFVRRLSRQHGR